MLFRSVSSTRRAITDVPKAADVLARLVEETLEALDHARATVAR